MKINESLQLSIRFKAEMHKDLSHAFSSYLPVCLIQEQASIVMPNSRDRIFTPVNTISAMLLSAIQEDKSLQNSLNIFKHVFESNCHTMLEAESVCLQSEKSKDNQHPRKQGRPKKYKTRLPKSYRHPLSDSTAGYATARKKLDISIFETVYQSSAEFGSLDTESWHGMKTCISDGTYLQLQDTDDIKAQYAVTQESTYPQALLQVLIRQGTGQINQFALGSRQESELKLVIPMIKKLEKNSLLLCDDLYNTYYHFCLVHSRECHMIVPGKRDRNYKVVRTLNDNDQIVEISKTVRPNYVSQEEWDAIPKTILLRRITYTYPTKTGIETALLYTTLLNEDIKTADIVAKYAMRWDIEISIRETKTIMDINVLRGKSRDMALKELLIALTAYNMVRKVIAESADSVGFPPQEDIFQKCAPFGRSILLDKRGRVFFKWSPGRYGYTKRTNSQTHHSASTWKKKTLYTKNQTGKISKI